MPEMQFDFDGLIQLLAGHLYSEKKVFIRELVQNAHDAIHRRAHADPGFSANGSGRIDIISSLAEDPGHIIFRDNGTGMSKKDLEDYLSSIGTSGTRLAQVNDHLPDVIGQFGIGFLSGFVVASRIEVRTRHFTEPDPQKGWLWKNEGKKEYSLEACEVGNPGTEIRVFLGDVTDRGLIQNDAIRDVIRIYADMLKVPIHLNHSEAPVNTRIMPWEREYSSERERDLEYHIFLERTVPDSVLEVIPVHIDEVTDEGKPLRASGLLYVTRTRRIAGDTPRTIRLFQKRMFVCENTPEIFPRWAVFINGILNTPDLRPNAARDNFVRDDSYGFLREKLGAAVIAHFEHLRDSDPDRLSQILAYHDLAIKSACDISEAFFEKFGSLLEWRVNGKSPAAKGGRQRRGRGGLPLVAGSLGYAWVTLPEIIAVLPEPEGGGAKRLTCFTTRSSANQFFEMADAAGTTVVDASYPFESGLLKTWARKHPGEINLSYIDREDDPAVFKDIDPVTDSAVRQLANEMTLAIRPFGGARLQVEARRFEPNSLTAVIKSSEASTGREKAESILNDPNAPSDLRAMAEDMIRMSFNADRRMSINAANPLIRQIADLVRDVGREDADVIELMAGIYNDAILYNQELMTPDNAKIFHHQFGRLMNRNAEFILQRQEITRRLQQVEEAETRLQPRSRTGIKRKHLVAFLMTPFAPEFDIPREGVRIAIEDRLGCKLRTADKETFDRFIHDNVGAHLGDADFFLVDLTGASPNVMLELGAVLYQNPRPPFVPIQRVKDKAEKPELPVDIASAIVMRYTSQMTAEEIGDELYAEIEKDRSLKQLLDGQDREKIFSASLIKKLARVPLDIKTCEKLSKAFPSASSWRNATDAEISAHLGEDAVFADAIRKNILRFAE
jgi:molecular chaperone HtpG